MSDDEGYSVFAHYPYDDQKANLRVRLKAEQESVESQLKSVHEQKSPGKSM